MKTFMKNCVCLTALCFLALGGMGCSDDESENNIDNQYKIALSAGENVILTFEPSPQAVKYITFQTDAPKEAIMVKQTRGEVGWCKVEVEDNGKVSVKPDDYSEITQDRTAQFAISVGEQNVQFLVRQAKAVPTAELISDKLAQENGKYTLSVSGEETSVPILIRLAYATEWTVVKENPEEADWITLEPETGNPGTSCVVKLSENSGTGERTVMLLVKTGDIVLQKISVSQAKLAPTASLESESLVYDSEEGIYRLKVGTAASKYTVPIKLHHIDKWIATGWSAWAKFSPSEGKDNENLIIDIPENTTSSSRVSTIWIYDSDWTALLAAISIEQEGKK